MRLSLCGPQAGQEKKKRAEKLLSLPSHRPPPSALGSLASVALSSAEASRLYHVEIGCFRESFKVRDMTANVKEFREEESTLENAPLVSKNLDHLKLQSAQL